MLGNGITVNGQGRRGGFATEGTEGTVEDDVGDGRRLATEDTEGTEDEDGKNRIRNVVVVVAWWFLWVYHDDTT